MTNLASFKSAGFAPALLLLAVAASPVSAQSPGIQRDLVLSDQFGAQAQVGAMASSGLVVLVYSAERDAADHLSAWKSALSAVLPAGTRIVLAADLQAVPFFVPKPAIVRGLADDYPGLPVLLDWKGALSKAMTVGKDKAIVGLWSAGRLEATARGTASSAGAASIAAAVRRLD